MTYCIYYQAHVEKSYTWFFVAILRSHEHLAFDRTFDKDAGIFELFVPREREQEFLSLMARFESLSIISQLKKLPNRLLEPDAIV